MQRKKAQPPKPKVRPILLTDPPPKPTPPTSTTDREDSTTDTDSRPPVSYSARARQSVGTAAASYKAIAIARSTEAAATTCQAPDQPLDGMQDTEKKEKSSRPRLSKVPPSASRTPHLFARSGPPTPPKDDAPPPPKDGKLNKLRRRSGSAGSTSSVSLTSRIRSSLELPRGRSISRDSVTSFVGGIRLRREKEADDEWRARDAAAKKPPSYSLPERYMYRQPGGSGLAGPLSRSASCSVASSGSLAAHFAPEVPATTFPGKRMSGPPVEVRTPDAVSKTDCVSGESEGGEDCESASRTCSQGPPDSRNALDGGTSGQRTMPFQESGSSGRSPRASSVPSPRRATLGASPVGGSNPTIPRVANGKEYPPSASASAFAYLACAGAEQAEPQRRRRGSLMGRLRGRRAEDSEDPQASDTPTQSSEDRSRARSASRSFKDAAKAAFRRSTSRGSSFRNGSNASEASSAPSPTKDLTSRVPDLPGPLVSNPSSPGRGPLTSNPSSPGRGPLTSNPSSPGRGPLTSNPSSPGRGPLTSNPPSPGGGPLTSNPSSPGRSGTDYPLDWPLSATPSPEVFPPPRPIADPHTTRPSDHSSVSSHETTRSHQRSSTLTSTTLGPQSETGIASTAGAGDDQKVLGGNEESHLASPAALGAGVPTRRTSTPAVRKKSSRRMLRNSAGSEMSTLSNAPATPKMSHAATASTPPAPSGSTAMPESEVTTQDVQGSSKPDAKAAEGIAPLQSRNHTSPVDPAMLPMPLNLHQGLHANNSTDSVAPHKLRRQAKSQHLLNGEAPASSPRSTEGSPASPDIPAEEQTPPVPRAEVASSGGAPSPRMSSQIEERNHRGRSREKDATQLERILVRCCGCGNFHDLPHRLYERMIMGFEDSLEAKEDSSRGEDKHVNCPWCRHVMDVRCCAGYVTVLQLKERLH